MANIIGKTISLISQSDIRYCGILCSIDAAQATLQLSNVYSMGTETRRPPAEYIPPQDTPYESILFRANEVKDISVDPQPQPLPVPTRNVRDDPAVIGVSQGAPAHHGYDNYSQYGPQTALPPTAPPANGASGPQSSLPNRRRDANGRGGPPVQNPNAVRSAATSLENVERAMGDLRIAAGNGGGRRGNPALHANDIQAGNIHVPATDFDFASWNAKFDKAALARERGQESDSDSGGEREEPKKNSSETVVEVRKDGGERKEKNKSKEGAYNPSKSFFDNLTPNPLGNRGGGGGAQPNRGTGARGRGRGNNRSRREEEAQRNLMTFGETISPSGLGGRRGGTRRGHAS